MDGLNPGSVDAEAPASSGCAFDSATLDFLFPCRFEVREDLTIHAPAPRLLVLAPRIDGAGLTETFIVEAAGPITVFADLAALDRSSVILHSRADPGLKLRGAISIQPDGRAVFLAAQAACEEQMATGLDPANLSPLDGAPDMTAALQQQAEETREAGTVIASLARARDEAVNRQEFFDAIVQMLPAILMVKDARDGRYVLVNRAAEEMLGVQAEALLGRNVHELFPPEEAKAFSDEDQAVIASGEMTVVEEETVTTSARGKRIFTTKKVATFGEEGARHIVTVGEDVTERIEIRQALHTALAAAEEAALSKSVFLANMSHEIRTPLNGIVAIADILQREPLDPRVRDMVGIISASGETLERLLSDILDQARIESGQITLETAAFHLGDMVRATAALGELKAREKGVALNIDLSPEVDVAVEGDMVRVRQILTNLVSNAVKFTEAGQVSITGYRCAEGRVRFEVRDTGEGFDEATRDRIFGRFQQADNTITRKYGGTGLGLAISRELASLMGGHLDCEGRPGQGAVFWFELPLPQVEDIRVPMELQAQAAAPPQLRILVADDHPTNRRVIELMLAGSADVSCVENGQEALDALAADSFDLVLMDMQMPVMDGLTAIRHQRAREASGLAANEGRLPIIMLTANALPEHVSASLAAGADRHLDKPITAATLFAALTDVFSARAA
ncbi:MAG: sensor hybrid histidine kinase [Caulobacter sp.]|nr:sensor hybrid histidine kinase [Caulobacter sp.]